MKISHKMTMYTKINSFSLDVTIKLWSSFMLKLLQYFSLTLLGW